MYIQVLVHFVKEVDLHNTSMVVFGSWCFRIRRVCRAWDADLVAVCNNCVIRYMDVRPISIAARCALTAHATQHTRITIHRTTEHHNT